MIDKDNYTSIFIKQENNILLFTTSYVSNFDLALKDQLRQAFALILDVRFLFSLSLS